MSLVAFGLRIALVQALREAPFFGATVLDSPDDPVEVALEDGSKPVIAVYSGDDVRKVTGRDVISSDRDIELTVQLYLPPVVSVLIDGGLREVSTSGRGGKIILNLFDREIERLIVSGDTPGARIFRDIIFTIKEFRTSPYLIDAGRGRRITASEYVLTLDTIASPAIGETPRGIWASLIDLMKQDPELGLLADVLTSAIEAPDGLVMWQKAMSALGTTEAGINAIGIGEEDVVIR